MNVSLAHAAPVRFLIGVTAAWTLARGVALVGWAPPSPPRAEPKAFVARVSTAFPLAARPRPAFPEATRQAFPLLLRAAYRAPASAAIQNIRQSSDPPLHTPISSDHDATRTLMLAAHSSAPGRVYQRSGGLSQAAIAAGHPGDRRLSGSAWAFLRGGGRATMLSPGQIGGGQAGARILYRIDRHLSAAARISTAIGGARQTEAALGLDWKPIDKIPIHLMAERRIAIDRGGRNAWTLGAAGGVDDVRIAHGWRFDAYGETGVVGAHRHDLYADGAARIARAIDMGGGKSLSIGGGGWGAAQPGAARLDIGPSVVFRLPVAHHAVAVALDWRERILGHDKPGSGLSLTVATDF